MYIGDLLEVYKKWSSARVRSASVSWISSLERDKIFCSRIGVLVNDLKSLSLQRATRTAASYQFLRWKICDALWTPSATGPQLLWVWQSRYLRDWSGRPAPAGLRAHTSEPCTLWMYHLKSRCCTNPSYSWLLSVPALFGVWLWHCVLELLGLLGRDYADWQAFRSRQSPSSGPSSFPHKKLPAPNCCSQADTFGWWYLTKWISRPAQR